jgi:hypothetical protein
MTEQPQRRVGNVAEEAARLIEDLATMARSMSSRSQDPGPYAGGPSQEPVSPKAPPAARWAQDPAPADSPEGAPADAPADAPAGTSSEGACSCCGGERVRIPEACRLCPLCQGIALLRTVRPEILDQLADFASAVTECLRDVAARSGASGPASPARPASGNPSDSGRTTQNIPVDDESEG